MAALPVVAMLAGRWAHGGYVSGDGVDEARFVELGGIDQYVRWRGRNRSAPLLVFLHGGPGFPVTYLGHRFEPSLVDDFVVVHWEQRGAGRTWHRNPELDSASVSLPDLVADLDALLDLLDTEFPDQPVVLVGQSWGSVLGLTYIAEHPHRVDGYIGVGQVVDFDEGKRLAALRAADRLPAGSEARAELLALRDAFTEDAARGHVDPETTATLIVSSLEHLPAGDQLTSPHQIWLGLTSPDLSVQDARWFLTATDTATIFALERRLVLTMYLDFAAADLGPRHATPIAAIQGEVDWITPTEMVRTWAAELDPPAVVTEIPGAGHTPFLDAPDAFADAVRGHARSFGVLGPQHRSH